MSYKLTLDSNLQDTSLNIPAMDTLRRWKDEGKLELVEANPARAPKTEAYNWPGAPPRTEAEKRRPGDQRRPQSKKMPESGNASFRSVASVLFPGKDPLKLNMEEINNVAHLIKHHASKNEIFVTINTKGFIDGTRRDLLKTYFGIITMTPDETVKMLCELEGWTPTEPKAASGRSTTPKSR